MVDWVPGVSQAKASLQLITGDAKGAKRTTENFVRECPGVSQITSLVQLADGDKKGALETQKRCLGTVNNIANGIPVIGYPKGAIHHIIGDHEGGNRALNAATRSTVVLGTAAATGGGGAALIAAGVGYDMVTSAATRRDQGTVKNFKRACDKPSAGSIFDATYSVAQPVINPVVFSSCSRRGTRVRQLSD